MTNSQAATHESWLVRCSRRAPGFSRSNQHEQAKGLSEAYIKSTFTYCPLIWMYCSKTLNNLINKIHKRNLRVIYEIEDANFEDLLIKESSWTIHENNIHTLLIGIYKSLNHISPLNHITPYSLRNSNLL